MEKLPNSSQYIEQIKSPERGANIVVSIDLIRHPEKDHTTGKLTQKGKDDFFNNLITDFQEGEEYDTVKFYVSPLSRGQEAKEPITAFLEAANIPTTIRNKEELIGRMRDIGPNFKTEMTKILEEGQLLTVQELAEVRQRDAVISASEPASKNFEIQTNELLIRDYFNKPFPASSFTGKDMGESVETLVDRFSRMTKHLLSNTKVKLVLVGHSGIIEHFTKHVYLQNHPEVKPEDVDVETIGGLVGFGEGPEITIRSDEIGKQVIELKFKDLTLTYDKYE
jgi:hypothetical protein